MPKRRRRAKIPTPAWERSHSALGRQVLGQSPKLYGAVAVAAVILIAIGIVGFAYWSDYREDQRRPDSTAVRVGDTKYTMRYFAERLKMFVQQVGGAGSQLAQPTTALPAVTEQIIGEAVVLLFAGGEGLSASEDDLKNEIATRLGLSPADTSYEARFQEELSRSGLNEDEYRRMIEAAVLQTKLLSKLEGQLPATSESVHYRQIVLADELAADETKRRVEAGEDFAAIAGEPTNLDSQSREAGGDAGWAPRGFLDPALEEFLFALDLNEAATYPLASGGVLVLQALEKEADREVDADRKAGMAQRELQDWVQSKRQSVVIENRVDLQSGDSDDLQWVVDRAYRPTSSALPGLARYA